MKFKDLNLSFPKRSLFFIVALIPTLAFAQVYKKHSLQKDRLSIQLSEGVLNITPLSDKAIRMQWEKGMREEGEFVLINKLPVPAFQFSETSSKLKLSIKAITVLFDKQTYFGLGNFYRLTYPLFVCQAIYDGQRRTDPQKRVAILTRWFQWGTFNPIFRNHGYQTETEPWKYGDAVEANMRSMLNLRYRLMPYIYSEAWQVSKTVRLS